LPRLTDWACAGVGGGRRRVPRRTRALRRRPSGRSAAAEPGSHDKSAAAPAICRLVHVRHGGDDKSPRDRAICQVQQVLDRPDHGEATPCRGRRGPVPGSAAGEPFAGVDGLRVRQGRRPGSLAGVDGLGARRVAGGRGREPRWTVACRGDVGLVEARRRNLDRTTNQVPLPRFVGWCMSGMEEMTNLRGIGRFVRLNRS